ncbi:MAG: hypothetical protein K0B14_04235 [Anaerolineaceae bacterium]|nr:hypothetical protein [Anaerolineaceae bacterium]
MRQTKFLLLLFLLVILVSCIPAKTEIKTHPSLMPSLSFPSVTASPNPSRTSTLSPTTTLENLIIKTATQPEYQVFIDPEGWFSFSYPKQWIKKSDLSYLGTDGFFEIGYIPEYSFYPNALTVCEWLANINTKNLYTVSWLVTVEMGGCKLLPRSGLSETTWAVVENSSDDISRRFFYIKTDNAHFEDISSTFKWIRPIEEKKKPDFNKIELRSEDNDFWSKTSSLPSNLVLKEYPLPSKYQSADHSESVFLWFIPPEALPTPSSSSHQSHSPTTVESINQSLEKNGYSLQKVKDSYYLYDLYQNNTRVLQNIYQLPEVYFFQTEDEEKLVFFAYTLIDPKQTPYTKDNVISYLVLDESISIWEKSMLNSQYPYWRPIWVVDKPLFLGLGDGTTLQVFNLQHEIIFSFASYFVTHVPIKKFKAWNNHWILEVSNFVVQDGNILNEKYNFEEVFDWFLIKENPFFFFRKGPRVGFSYDKQFFSTYYHEVIHGYCCGLILNNPSLKDDVLRFFGKRDGIWYYVVLEFR